MSAATVTIHKLPNGITLLGEYMPFVSSAALSVLLPTGAVNDPTGQEGTASILAEMLNKGAGKFDNRALSDQFESLGIHHSSSAGIEVSILSGALLGENITQALTLFGTMLREPTLPPEELESIRQLALQELRSLEDEPASKVMVELARRFYPEPFGRSQLGTEAGVKSVTIDSLRKFFSENYRPGGMVIGIAGKFDWSEVVQCAGKVFGGWSGDKKLLEVAPLRKESLSFHLEKESNQVQIALAYPSVSFGHRDYYTARVAIGVLSGGMAGRLFIEVREKRGLVYRVSASHSAARGRAAVFCYAGTTPERAAETLQVMVDELKKLSLGVTEEELKRSKADIKSRLIMQGESSSMRASALVNDWWNLGRVRTLDEIQAGIDQVTEADLTRHLTEFPVAGVTLVCLGPKRLELPQ